MFPTSSLHADSSSNLLSDSASFDVDSPTNDSRKIDYTKFKTKMCRNYLMGLQCPFEDRCAFAHGDLQIRSNIPPPPPPPFCDSPMKNVAMMAPPSYNAFISSTNESPAESRPATPPAYPTRFRYEPYSESGIVFEA